MKKLSAVVLLTLMSFNLLAQSKKQLPQTLINEFAERFNILCEYDDNFVNTIFSFIHKRSPSLEKSYVNNLLIDVANNSQARDVIFQAYYDIARYFGNPQEEYLYVSLLKLNLRESTTRTIKNFILESYRIPKTIEKENVEIQKVKNINDRRFKVVADKAFFYNLPNQGSIRNVYLSYGEIFNGEKSENDFVFTTFKDFGGKQVKGWISNSDVVKIDTSEIEVDYKILPLSIKQWQYNIEKNNVLHGATNEVSFSLGDRTISSIPRPNYVGRKEGVIVVQVSVDKLGRVKKAEAGVKGSNTVDREMIYAAKKAALQSKFNVDVNAPIFQIGTITYRFVFN